MNHAKNDGFTHYRNGEPWRLNQFNSRFVPDQNAVYFSGKESASGKKYAKLHSGKFGKFAKVLASGIPWYTADPDGRF